jgi:short-subunit dehydrogenase
LHIYKIFCTFAAIFYSLQAMKTAFALVTGASSGMGLEFARQLAQRGYNLLIVSNEEKIHEVAKELEEAFSHTLSVVSLVMDLGQQSAARELYDYTHTQGMEIEVLVNNAGVYHDRDILDDSEGFTSLIMNLHMYTPAMLCYLFGRDMKARGKGYILNVCSVTSKMAAQRLGTYGGTKAFLSHFTRALHIELRRYGVHVTDVSPGAVDTGLYNIKPVYTKIGKCLGIIVSPETLVRRALRALFWGWSKTTIPTVFWRVLCFIILLIPTCLLRLIRRLGWF